MKNIEILMVKNKLYASG